MILQDMTQSDVLAKIDAQQARIAELEAKLARSRNRKLSMKVTEKGGLSVYGLGRFPVSLYRGQWERLLDCAEEIRAFIADNSDTLSVKD